MGVERFHDPCSDEDLLPAFGSKANHAVKFETFAEGRLQGDRARGRPVDRRHRPSARRGSSEAPPDPRRGDESTSPTCVPAVC
jgi:hypothetical protein